MEDQITPEGSDDDYDSTSDEDDEIPNIILDPEKAEQAGVTSDLKGSGRGRNFTWKPDATKSTTSGESGTRSTDSTDIHEENQSSYMIDIDTLEEQPWRQPGADITDYFNYGFNENTWKTYCQKQVQFRVEQSMQSKIQVYESKKPEKTATTGGGGGGSSGGGYPRGGGSGGGGRQPPRGQDDNVIQVVMSDSDNSHKPRGRDGPPFIEKAPPSREFFGVPPTQHGFPPNMPFPPFQPFPPMMPPQRFPPPGRAFSGRDQHRGEDRRHSQRPPHEEDMDRERTGGTHHWERSREHVDHSDNRGRVEVHRRAKEDGNQRDRRRDVRDHSRDDYYRERESANKRRR